MGNPVLENIKMVCKEHASKPDPSKQTLKPRDYVGKYVKKEFATNRKDAPDGEHMWVKVTHTEGCLLVGKLNNQPIVCRHIKWGDEVTVRIPEIEDVYAD